MSVILSISFCACAQSILPKVPEAYYGIDQKHKVVVCHLKPEWITQQVKELQFFDTNKNLFTWKADSISTQKRYEVIIDKNTYHFYFIAHPLIKISIKDSIVDEPKKMSQLTYAYHDTILQKKAGIELRGNISLTFPKKSYDLEFRNSDDTETSEDVQFLDMRNDDDWILDGLYNEALRIRSHFSNQLWQHFYKISYQAQEPEAKSGISTAYVELFVNNQYKGIYSLTEQVDSKLLALKKIEKEVVQGELFKASSYEGGPTFEKAPDYKNIFPHWAGYAMEYPIVDYKSYWNNLHDFVKFVIESPTQTFNQEIANQLDLRNAANYFIFVNTLRATDNLGKNFYLARYDQTHPYFFVPWDLDGVMGSIQDGKRIPTTDDILTNQLFDRLLKDNPADYKKILKNRWSDLREGVLETNQLLEKITTIYQNFQTHKIYEREQKVWNMDTSFKDDYTYLKDWTTKRLQYLDGYFNSL